MQLRRLRLQSGSVDVRSARCRTLTTLRQAHTLQRRLAPMAVASPWSESSIAPRSDAATLSSTEREIDISLLLEEVTAASSDLVFSEAPGDSEAWQFEGRFTPTRDPEEAQPASPSPFFVQPGGALDMTSAYSTSNGFREITAHELRERQAAGQVALVLDVRDPAAAAPGSVDGARACSLAELSQWVRSGELDEYRARPVAVVGDAGTSAAQAVVRLTKVFKFEDVICVRAE